MSERKRYRVLVIEDDRDLAETVAASLAEKGHQSKAQVVTGKTKLEEVILTAREWKPDAILLDHSMPIEGTAFLAGFLADPGTRGVPVLLFTGADNVPQEVRQLVFATIRKPFQVDALVSLLENAVGMRARSNAARPN